jgi:SAM-dependent methyltransferase
MQTNSHDSNASETSPVAAPFETAAQDFCASIDRSAECGTYIRGKLFTEAAKRVIPSGGYVLDYGCGPGRIAMLLARLNYRVRGVDPSASMIALANGLDAAGLQVKFELGIGDGQELEKNAYDAIVCSSVIQYVQDPGALLARFHAALRADGVVLISYANTSSLWFQYYWRRHRRKNAFAPAHRRAWTWTAFKALLQRNCFQPISGPTYFESPLDGRRACAGLASSRFIGSLGLVVCQRSTGGRGDLRVRI